MFVCVKKVGILVVNKTAFLHGYLYNVMPAVVLQMFNGPQTEPCCTPTTKGL